MLQIVPDCQKHNPKPDKSMPYLPQIIAKKSTVQAILGWHGINGTIAKAAHLERYDRQKGMRQMPISMSSIPESIPIPTYLFTQMVSNGNEGWRASGLYDPYAPVTYPFLNWMNNGTKGAVRRLKLQMAPRLT